MQNLQRSLWRSTSQRELAQATFRPLYSAAPSVSCRRTTIERIANLLVFLSPVWPALAAAVLSMGRRPNADKDGHRLDRECRTVAAAASLLSCGSLLAALWMGQGMSVMSLPASISLPSLGIASAFQLRLDALSGPAAIAATFLSFVAVVAARREADNGLREHPPYGRWMLLLCCVIVMLLAGDVALLIASLIACELVCVSLAPRELSWVRPITMLPFVWMALHWMSLFAETRLEHITRPVAWVELARQQPMFTLISGLCLLTCIAGRMALYPFCIDVDRAFDDSPGRLFWWGCLGSWIPAQYLLLRFAPLLSSSAIGGPSLMSIAVLLGVLAVWLALTRPRRAGSLAMIGAGLFAITWIGIGSGHPFGWHITAAASLAIVLLFGGLGILADSRGWLKASRAAVASEHVTGWQNLADAGRRLFYLPEMGRLLTWPLRQIVELPANIEALRIPEAELVGEPDDEARLDSDATTPISSAASWLLPLAGLTSIALIWALLLAM